MTSKGQISGARGNGISRQWISAATGGLVLIGLHSAAHADDYVQLSTGFDYSSGDYGDVADTDITSIPVSLKVVHGPITGRLTVPYLRIKGPGAVVGGGDTGGVVTGVQTVPVTTESGIGDVVAGFTYTFDLIDQDLFLDYIDMTAKVKIPTADEQRNLGTGETDFSIQTDVSKSFDKLVVFGTLGYKFVGSSQRLPLDDIVYLSIGGGYQLTPTISAGIAYDYRQAASRTAEDPSEISPYFTVRLNESWRFQGYAYFGLSESSPDAGVGAQLSYRFYLGD